MIALNTRRVVGAATLTLGLAAGWSLSQDPALPGPPTTLAAEVEQPESPAPEPELVRWDLDFGPALDFDVLWVHRAERRMKIERADESVPVEVQVTDDGRIQFANGKVARKPRSHEFFVDPVEFVRLIDSGTPVEGVGPEGPAVLRPVFHPDGQLTYLETFGHCDGRPEEHRQTRGSLRRVDGRWIARFRGDLYDGVSAPTPWDAVPFTGGVLEVHEVDGKQATGRLSPNPAEGGRVVGRWREDGGLEVWVQMSS